MSFEQALDRLKEISEYLQDNEDIDLEQLTKLKQEAQELYEFCKDKLQRVQDQEE